MKKKNNCNFTQKVHSKQNKQKILKNNYSYEYVIIEKAFKASTHTNTHTSHTPTLNIHTYIVKREVKQQHYKQHNKYMIIIIYIIPKIKDNSQTKIYHLSF